MSDTISIVGNVATDPKQHAPGGIPITSFRLAVSQRRYDKSAGEWVDGATNWYSISAFRGLGEHTLSSVKKGDRVFVSGRLRIRDWTAGEKSGTSAEIEAESLGHDLLWGTTVFTKAGVAMRAGDPHSESALPGDDQQWHVPMGDSPQGAQAPIDGAPLLDGDDSSMALVDAAGPATPF